MLQIVSSISVVAPPGATVEYREDGVVVTCPGYWPRWAGRGPDGTPRRNPRNQHERRRAAALERARAV